MRSGAFRLGELGVERGEPWRRSVGGGAGPEALEERRLRWNRVGVDGGEGGRWPCRRLASGRGEAAEEAPGEAGRGVARAMRPWRVALEVREGDPLSARRQHAASSTATTCTR